MKIRSVHHGTSKSQVADENEIKETTRKEDCCKRMRWKQESTEISDEEIRVRADRKIRRKRITEFIMMLVLYILLVNEFEPPTLIISVILILISTYTKESVPNFSYYIPFLKYTTTALYYFQKKKKKKKHIQTLITKSQVTIPENPVHHPYQEYQDHHRSQEVTLT